MSVVLLTMDLVRSPKGACSEPKMRARNHHALGVTLSSPSHLGNMRCHLKTHCDSNSDSIGFGMVHETRASCASNPQSKFTCIIEFSTSRNNEGTHFVKKGKTTFVQHSLLKSLLASKNVTIDKSRQMFFFCKLDNQKKFASQQHEDMNV